MATRRNALDRFRSGQSNAIVDITFRPQEEVPIDFTTLLGDGALIVEFQERGTYQYNGVNYLEYVNFKNASSWGEYFNNYIRPNYLDYERIG